MFTAKYYMLSSLKFILLQREAILFLGLLSGLLVGELALWTKSLVLPALGLALTISTIDIPNSFFISPKELIRGIFYGTVLSYGILGLPFFALALFFPAGSALQNGLLLIAVAPPAVAVLPFTVLLRGDQAFSLAACIGGYLSSLLIFPLASFFFWQDIQVPQSSLIFTLVLLIVLPLVISRLIRHSPIVEPVRMYRGTLVNWCFFLVIVTIVGINRDYLSSHPELIPKFIVIAFLLTFGLGWIIDKAGKVFVINKSKRTSMVLLSTLKNYGIASGLAIQFFPPESALPPVVCNMIMILYFIWLSIRFRKQT